LDPQQTAEVAVDEVLRLHYGWPADRRRARVAELTGLVGLDARQARAVPRPGWRPSRRDAAAGPG
jgi:ABC-type microcin C transport system duplicated ATPase subunit YejF